MAIGYLKVSTISRNGGATACARMAYVCRARVEDPRTEITHDYTRRSGDVEAVGVVGWAGTPASLAAAMSAAEKRKDACEGRSVILALPCEIDAAARERVVVAWCSDLRARHGVACAYALHRPDAHGDERNWHAHVIISARRSDGWAFGEKTRELDTPRTGGVEVEAWRVAWAARCAEELSAAGVSGRVEMKSWKRRMEASGLPTDLVDPSEHLGPARSALERRGQRTAAGERNRKRRLRRREVQPMLAERNAIAREIRAAKEEEGKMSGNEKKSSKPSVQAMPKAWVAEQAARRAAARSRTQPPRSGGILGVAMKSAQRAIDGAVDEFAKGAQLHDREER